MSLAAYLMPHYEGKPRLNRELKGWVSQRHVCRPQHTPDLVQLWKVWPLNILHAP